MTRPWGRRLLAAVSRALGVDPGDPALRAAAAGELDVDDLDIGPGVVTANVTEPAGLGAEPAGEPHRVRIGLETFDEDTWDAVATVLAADAWCAASLLAGEVPDDLDDRLTGLVGSLLPRTARELPVDCTCRDWATPCRHAASALAALARRVDEEPFELVRWRGRSPAALRGAVREHRESAPAAPAVATARDFWRAGGTVPAVPDPPARERPEDLLDRVPPTGVEVDGQDLRDALRAVYRRFAQPAGPRPREGGVGPVG